MYDHVLSGLIRRRREMECDLNEVSARAASLGDGLAALDKVILMFSPSKDLADIPAFKFQPKPDWAGNGEVSRIILETLRTATSPLPTRELLTLIHQRRGLEGDPTALQGRRLRKSLDRQRARGVVRSDWVEGELCWGLVR